MEAESAARNDGRELRNRKRREVSEQFEKYWGDEKMGHFTPPDSPRTVFSQGFIDEVREMEGVIVEAGAGAGIQICDMAQELEEIERWHAVETSRTALRALRRNIKTAKVGDRVKVASKDLLEFLRAYNPEKHGELAGFYANSVLHVLESPDRAELMELLWAKMAVGAVIGVSFKTVEDALAQEGTIVEQQPAGVVIEGKDGIKRLFVNDFTPLAHEFAARGFEVVQEPHFWGVEGYNTPGVNSEFGGLILRKKSNGEAGKQSEDAGAEEQLVLSRGAAGVVKTLVAPLVMNQGRTVRSLSDVAKRFNPKPKPA